MSKKALIALLLIVGLTPLIAVPMIVIGVAGIGYLASRRAYRRGLEAAGEAFDQLHPELVKPHVVND
jgi:Flp pilus assembly protein TadB